MGEDNPRTWRKTLRASMRSSNNKLNPLMMPDPEFEPRPHWWEVRVPTTTPSLLPI